MDDDARIGVMKKCRENGRTTRRPKHTMFVHHRAHMARVRIGLETTRTRSERFTAEPPRL